MILVTFDAPDTMESPVCRAFIKKNEKHVAMFQNSAHKKLNFSKICFRIEVEIELCIHWKAKSKRFCKRLSKALEQANIVARNFFGTTVCGQPIRPLRSYGLSNRLLYLRSANKWRMNREIILILFHRIEMSMSTSYNLNESRTFFLWIYIIKYTHVFERRYNCVTASVGKQSLNFRIMRFFTQIINIAK